MPDQTPSSADLNAVPPAKQPSWFDGPHEKIASWIFNAMVGVIAFLAVTQFNSIRDEQKEIRADLKEVNSAVGELRLTLAQIQGQDLHGKLERIEEDVRRLERRLWQPQADRPYQPSPRDPATTPR